MTKRCKICGHPKTKHSRRIGEHCSECYDSSMFGMEAHGYKEMNEPLSLFDHYMQERGTVLYYELEEKSK